jgi:hypothetical protein
MESESNKRIYAKIVAKAWSDDAFKAHFLKHPTKTARDFGMDLPDDTVVVVVDSGHTFSLDSSGPHPKLTVALPPRPEDLIDQAILKISTNAYNSSKGCLTDI